MSDITETLRDVNKQLLENAKQQGIIIGGIEEVKNRQTQQETLFDRVNAVESEQAAIQTSLNHGNKKFEKIEADLGTKVSEKQVKAAIFWMKVGAFALAGKSIWDLFQNGKS